MKKCSKCHVEQPESQFVKSARYSDGYYPSCKTCRKKVKLEALSQNPLCSRCHERPHLGYTSYCAECNREVKGRPVPTKVVDRNNTTMCSRCKVNLRLPYHNYCQSCKNASVAEWSARGGGSWAVKSAQEKLKAVARRAVLHRVQRGTMERKTACEICGASPVEMHHHKGYEGENAFDVQWLCIKHHKAAHK